MLFVCHVQPLLPPPILLLLGVVLFGSGEAARFRNYQKHGGGEVCSSSFPSPLLFSIISIFITLFLFVSGCTSKAACSRNYQKHGGGEVCSSSFPLL